MQRCVLSSSIANSATATTSQTCSRRIQSIAAATTRRTRQQQHQLPRTRIVSSPSTTPLTKQNTMTIRRRKSSLVSSSTKTKTSASKPEMNNTPNNTPLWLKNIRMSSKVRNSLPMIGHASYLALVSGFCMTDMLQLRVALVSGYTGLVAFHAFHPRPLTIPLRWSALFIVVNASAAIVLALDRFSDHVFTPEEEQLYQEHFSNHMTRGQYSQLISLSTTQSNIPDGTVLTVEGQVCENIFFLQKGQAKMYHHKQFASNIDEGGFVNDVAFQQGTKDHHNVEAYGTVIVSSPCEEGASVICWDQAVLRDYLAKRPELERNMNSCLNDHLVKSLLRQREATHERQQQCKLQTKSSITEHVQEVMKRKMTNKTEQPKPIETDATLGLQRSPSRNNITWVGNEQP